MNRLKQAHGFTLVELMLATFIASLVIGIASASLTFCLSAWEQYRDRSPSNAPYLVSLLNWQLACFNPTPVRIEGKDQLLFEKKENSLAFATDHSVKAISKGAPVIARYIYEEGDRKVYYAETPLNPNDPEGIEDFLGEKPREEEDQPLFHSVEIGEMTFEYEGEYGKDEDERGGEDSVPRIVLVKWREAPKNETEGEAEAAYVLRSVVGFLPAPSRSGAWSNPNQQQSQTKTE